MNEHTSNDLLNAYCKIMERPFRLFRRGQGFTEQSHVETLSIAGEKKPRVLVFSVTLKIVDKHPIDTTNE